jgi:carbon catabolite-derepressing protein kinase
MYPDQMRVPRVPAHYQVLFHIIEGDNSEVWAAVHLPSETEVVMKFPKEGCSQTEQEAFGVVGIEHDAILSILDVIPGEFGPILVYPYCKGGDMFNYVVEHGQLTEYEANVIAFEVLNALVYLHANSIWHRDIKPENIFLRSREIAPGNVILGDLGFVVRVEEDWLNGDWPGTEVYSAPEQRERQPYKNTVDIYGLGKTLWLLLTRTMPSDDMDLNELSTEYGLSEDCVKLMEAMLDPNPETRVTAREARQHRWFIDWWRQIFPDEDDVEGVLQGENVHDYHP